MFFPIIHPPHKSSSSTICSLCLELCCIFLRVILKLSSERWCKFFEQFCITCRLWAIFITCRKQFFITFHNSSQFFIAYSKQFCSIVVLHDYLWAILPCHQSANGSAPTHEIPGKGPGLIARACGSTILLQPYNKLWSSFLRPGWYAYYLLQIYRKVSVPI